MPTTTPVDTPQSDILAGSSADHGAGRAGRPLPRLVAMEELAMRGLWSRDGAYRALTRSGLPYVLIMVGSSQGPRWHRHRRVAVSERVAAELLRLRVVTARRRGIWTALDYADFGLEAP